jgi:hypothetical protein
MSLRRLGVCGSNSGTQPSGIISTAAVHMANVLTVAKPCQPLPQVPPCTQAAGLLFWLYMVAKCSTGLGLVGDSDISIVDSQPCSDEGDFWQGIWLLVGGQV